MPYSYRDQYGDSYTVPESGTVGSGATLPAGYTNTPNGDDCDDTNPAVWAWPVLYVDKDGDGVGVPPPAIFCEGNAVPAGDSRYGDDQDDSNPDAGAVPAEDLLELFLN